MGNLSIWHAPNVSAAANISLWGSWASCFCHLSRSKPYVVGANLMTLLQVPDGTLYFLEDEGLENKKDTISENKVLRLFWIRDKPASPWIMTMPFSSWQ